MSNELTGSRYDNLIRRVGNMQGPGSKLNELVPSGMPTFPLEGGPHELLRLARTNTYFAGVTVVNGVGLSAFVFLQNPANSGLIVTIRQFMIRMTSSSHEVSFGVRDGNTAGTQVFTSNQVLDSRCPARSGAQLRTATGAGIGSSLLWRFSTATAFVDWDATLLPDSEAYLELTTDSVTFHAGYVYRERIAEQSELTA